MFGVQDIVEGVTPPRCEYMNGFSTCPEVKDTFCARVHDIFPPQVFSLILSLVSLKPSRVTLEFPVEWSTLSQERR